MSLEAAMRLTELALALALLQRGAEHLRREPGLFAPQMALAVLLLSGFASGAALAGLWALGLAQLRRFHGPYNGGADKMLLLCLSCTALATIVPAAAIGAMGYLALQLLLSYVVSGWVKLRNPDWRSGQALAEVFAFSAYPVSEGLRGWAERRTALRLASWGVIGFELAMPLALVSPQSLAAALSVAAAFHFANAMLFGLNRFFWAWIAAYPALIWLRDVLFP